jgi:hypothetical protein
MPRLSNWFIRAALIYLAAGFTLGALLLANKGIPFDAGLWQSLPAHMEFLLMGWTVQLALGVAFWILPRLGGSAPRGNERLVLLSFVLINLGIWLVAAQSLVSLQWLTLLGRTFETAGVVAFVAGAWARIKPFGV